MRPSAANVVVAARAARLAICFMEISHRRMNASAGDSADNVIETYTVDTSAETAAGVWTLRVQDTASLDTGYIDS